MAEDLTLLVFPSNPLMMVNRPPTFRGKRSSQERGPRVMKPPEFFGRIAEMEASLALFLHHGLWWDLKN